MAVQSRPYFIIYNGVHHMVEANNPGAVVRHVVGAAVTELKPASGAEVAAWVRSGKDIPVAGQKAATKATEDLPDSTQQPPVESAIDPDREGWDEGDTGAWLIDNHITSSAAAVQAWQRVIGEKRLTLEHFDIIREAVPALAEALCYSPTGDVPVDQIRSALEGTPMPLGDLVDEIGKRKHRELYEAAPASEGLSEPLAADTKATKKK